MNTSTKAIKQAGLLSVMVAWVFSMRCHAEQTTNELDSFQGNWKMVSLEIRGKNMTAPFTLVIKNDQWTVIKPDGSSNGCPFQINAAMLPKQIDLIPLKTNAPSSLGIYKFEGDRLTICRTMGGTERPKEFKTTKSADILAVWQRAGK